MWAHLQDNDFSLLFHEDISLNDALTCDTAMRGLCFRDAPEEEGSFQTFHSLSFPAQFT